MPKLRTSHDHKFLLGVCLKVGISDVGCPQLKSIQFGQECDQAKPSQSDNSRTHTLHGDFGQMAIGHQAGFVPTIMLHRMDQMDTDLLVSIGCADLLSFTCVLESVTLPQLLQFWRGLDQPPVSVPGVNRLQSVKHSK